MIKVNSLPLSRPHAKLVCHIKYSSPVSLPTIRETTMTTTSNQPETSSDNHSQSKLSTSVSSPDAKEQQEQAISDEDMSKQAHVAKSHRRWNRRLKIFFCCLGYKKNKDSIADVASIFAEFYADLNVPSSDFAAGFVLLSKYQAAQRHWIVKNNQLNVEQYLSSVPITRQTSFLDISTAQDSHLINDLIYYMNYGLAIFGWPMSVLDDPMMLCCIYPYLRMPFCCRRSKRKVKKKEGQKEEQTSPNQEQPGDHSHTSAAAADRSQPGKLDDDVEFPIVLADNCCGCNFASVERRLAAHNYEIIYVSYKVDVNVVPFLVAADHSKQSVVVAIRGSMSLSDMVTDMNGQIDRLPIDDCPEDWLCHRGITRASCYVRDTLIRERILEAAFNCRPDLGSHDYNLVLCGHSLGAGAAAILGILIRPLYPNLRAYLYSPPGGILSLPAVEHTKEFATGIILGNDCVPRLGVAQLERLRYQVLLSLKSSQKSTSKILAKALCPSCCLGGNKVDYDPSLSLNLLHGTGGRSFDYNGCKIPFQVQPQVLYVPGRLVHIVKNHTFKSRARRLFNEPIYQAIWSDNTMYDRIMISEGMFYDHLPNNLMHAMKMLFSKTLPARKETKPQTEADLHSEIVEKVQPPRDPSDMYPENEVIKRLSSSKSPKLEVAEKDVNNNIGQEEYDENNNISQTITSCDPLYPSFDAQDFAPNETEFDGEIDGNGNVHTVVDRNL